MNKVAIVTGAGGPNMGRATARLLAARGMAVCVADVDDAQGRETVEIIRGDGGQAMFVNTDLLHETSIATMVDQVVATFGAVHILCNFAALYEPRVGLMETTSADFDRILGVTLRGSWLATKHAMKAMLRNPLSESQGSRGAIIFVASVLAHRGSPDYLAYTVAKSGVLGLVRAAALDGAPHGIRANCISPGITRTPATPMPTPESEYDLARLGALSFVGEPEDMASAAAWLCDDESRFVTGATLNIDGGWTAKL